MKIGDLVICHCESDTWYKGITGMLVGFELNGIEYDYPRGSALVLYDAGRTVLLHRVGLQVVS